MIGDILLRLNAPYGAASVLSDSDLGLQAKEAAAMVRWGEDVVPPEPENHFKRTDEALARLEALIHAASLENPPDSGLLLRLKGDRIVALRNRERWNDAVESAEAIRSDGNILPLYVKEAEADSLLALHHPEQALEGYQSVLAADPRNKNAQQGLFYAQVETEDFSAAFNTVDAISRKEGAAFYLPRMAGATPNPEWLDAVHLAAMARYYASMNSDAWKRLQPLAEGAPAIGYLRSARGELAADRGWPRRAEEEIEIAAELAPEDRGVQIALAESCLRRKRFREARRMAEQLSLLYPGDIRLQRLKQDIAAAQGFELQLETLYRNESGHVADRPGSEVDASSRLYFPAFAERWRVFAAFDYFSAKPAEGFVDRIRYGTGVDVKWPDFALEATAWNNTGTLFRGGASLSGTWEASDQLSFSASGELFSTDTPLRAVLHGITANGGSFRISYAANESFAVSGSIGGLSFTDGNQRLQASLTLSRRITDRPHFKLTIHPEGYASKNTRLDAPYFNPQHDVSANLSVEADHILWRRYERSFRHGLTAGAGSYWEAHYRPDWVGQISYQQTFQIDPGLAIHYGVDVARRIYDGQSVRDLDFRATLEKAF